MTFLQMNDEKLCPSFDMLWATLRNQKVLVVNNRIEQNDVQKVAHFLCTELFFKEKEAIREAVTLAVLDLTLDKNELK